MAINMTDPPTLPDLSDQSTFNSRALNLFSWIKDTFIPELEAIDGPDLGGAVQTQGDVLDDLNTLGANAADGEFLVGTGAGALAWESGATARESIGLGTSDSPEFAGVYLGGSVAANLLDDYEEGSWTPSAIGTATAGSATYSTQQGSYTKIGNMVYFTMHLAWTDHTGTGNLRFSGLPFTPNTDNQIYPCSVAVSGLSAGSDKFISAYPVSADTNIRITAVDTNGGGNSDIPVDANVNYIVISGYYRTDA